VTAVAAFDAVGAILAIAMLVTPAAAAYLWTDRLSVMMALACAFGALAAFPGYYVAQWLDTSVSATMAFCTGVIFLVSILFSPRHGIIVKRWRNRQRQAA